MLMHLPMCSIVVHRTLSRCSTAELARTAFSSPRTMLSASALYARSMSLEMSETILRPCAAELFTVQFVVAEMAPPSLRAIALIRS